MNKIFIEKDSNIDLKEDTLLTIEKNSSIILNIKSNIKVFILCISSNVDLEINTNNDLVFNMFSFDSSIKTKLNILKDSLNINYSYSTINEKDNSYEIDINHLAKNINSNVINHGINKDKKLEFIINTIVPKNVTGIKTSQDSKIITTNNDLASIKPNLYIDNDDIEANHSAYIGSFKEEEIFYLNSRGLTKKDAKDLLVNAFLIGNMNLNTIEKDLMLKQIKRFWR